MYLCEVTCCFTFDLPKSVRTIRYTLKLKQAANIAIKVLGIIVDAFVPRYVHFVASCGVHVLFHSYLSRILFSTITVDNFVDKVWAQLISDVSITDFCIQPVFCLQKKYLFSGVYK